MEDRQYQIDLINNVEAKLSSHQTVLAQLPTGGGKTVIFTKLTRNFFRNHKKSVMIMVHREELMYQAARTIKSILDIDPVLITKSTKEYKISRVYIGMVESTLSRLHLFGNVGLFVIDECHIANFNKVHDTFPNEKILGFTATPLSSSKLKPLNGFYECIISGPQINELIKLGFLAQNITRCPKDIVDSTKLEIDNRKGDFNENQMAKEFSKPKYVTNVIDNYFKFCKGEKTLVFNVNIEHSEEVNRCFLACGYNSRHLDAGSSNKKSIRPGFKNEREEMLDWFKNTDNAILNNVMIATVGFDEPSVRNIFLNFSTLSLPKFVQTSGRGSRKTPYKDYFNIIDMGGNCIRFGDWNDDRDWEYIFNNPSKPGSGVAPIKICPSCEGIVHASVRVCPLKNEKEELCQYEFEKKPEPKELDLEEMILITKGIDIDALIGKSKKKYEYYTFFELAVEVVKDMYSKYEDITINLKIKYFKIYYQLCINWYNKTMAGKDGNIPDITNSSWHLTRAQNNFSSLVEKHKDLQIVKQQN